MPESTLSMGYPEFREELGHFLNYGRTTGNWTAAVIADVEGILQRGMRQFLLPPPVNAGEAPHDWTFLHPITTLDTVASYDTGTVTSASAVVTLSGGTWPSWAATHGTLTVDSTDHAIASRDGDTQITLTAAPSSAFSADTFTLKHDGNYDLLDDFGTIEGRLTYDEQTFYPPIRVTGEGQIRAARQRNILLRDRPLLAAIRVKAFTGAAGQRFEILFWPIPSAVYTLTYKYTALPGKLTSALPYPPGGMLHAETVLASMLAVAELSMNNERGEQWEKFRLRLAASIQLDKRQTTGEFFGYNGDPSDHNHGHDGHYHGRHTAFNVTYDGVQY